MRRDGDSALHVGDARPVAAAGVVAERPLGGGAVREDGVVVAEQRHARGALAFERRVQVEPRVLGRDELGMEAVALERVRHRRREPVERRRVVAGRVDVHPGLQVGEERVELCCRLRVHPPSLRQCELRQRHRGCFALTSAATVSFVGASSPTSRATPGTAPLRTSISQRRPARRSRSIEGRAFGIRSPNART